MREVNISQLWGRTWDLFKGNWLLFVGLLVLFTAQFIIAGIFTIAGIWGLDISILMAIILAPPVLVRAGYLVARQKQYSLREDLGDLSPLLKVLIYQFILGLIPGSFVGLGFMLVDQRGDILVLMGYTFLFISYLFGWAGHYAILSGRAGIFSAIGQSFSLTWWNFSEVFVALLSVIGLLILGLLPLGLGLLMEVPILILGGGYLYRLWLLVVVPMASIFLPLLYFALTDEEGVPHS
jgi:hypothetical protein